LVLGVDVFQVNVALLIVVTKKVVANLYVFGFGVEDWVFGNTDGTRAITKKWHSPELQTKISQGGYHPKELGATTSSGNIFGFCG
jgi:hypothetical protein